MGTEKFIFAPKFFKVGHF